MEIGSVQLVDIEREVREAYLDYAMSVITARALPDVRDGLKPVQRRILYTMFDSGLRPDRAYKKSAATVGDVLGKYHPHGDSAVYDAMVRLAQDFSMRYPLVDGQGNFGCFTGDTKIKLLDGTERTFAELAELPPDAVFHVYSVDASGRIVVGDGRHSRITRRNAEVIELTLDDGSKVRCTPDHRFMLRDGSWREAQFLTIEDSLMAGYFDTAPINERTNDYLRVLQPTTGQHEEVVAVAATHNHRVVGIRWLADPIDVYDITVDEHHNFMLANGCVVHNSIDGDPAAAHRYTEARPAPLAMEMLADIDMNTVDTRPNYDDSRTEPTVLPARIPNLLLNGASGIAVGMATNIPPHNLVEVCEALVHIIDHFDAVDDITPEQLTQFIHGPDFPTGASIMGRGGILNAYATGRGRVLMRAKAHFEEIRPGREAIIVTEIPFQVNKATLLERIADLVRSKRVETISDLRDETDRTGIRIVIELKRGADAGITLNQLYKYSQLQQTFGINMLALVDGEPRVLPLKRMLVLYLEHRRDVTRRRTVYELERARARQHVLEGLRIALSQLDAIIETIRRSPDAAEARVNLMTGFELSEIQAQAILDMQLRRLAALEREKIEEEYRAVTERIEYLDALLADEGKILAVIREDIEDIKTRYGDARRTSIDHDVSELLDEDLVAEENVLITVSQRGYIKRVLASTYRAQHRGGRGIIGAKTRADDLVRDNFVAGTRDTLLLFTDRGRVFQLRAYQVPETSREATGTPVANLIQIDAGERVTVVLAVPPGHFETGDYLVMVTVGGRIKRTDLKEYASVRPSGLIAINLDAGDALGWAKITTGENEIILATRRGKALRFHEHDARPMGRAAAGVNAIRLRKGDSVAAMDIVDPEADLLVVTRRGYGKRTPMSEYNLQGRFGQGVLTIDARRLGEIGEVVDARVVRDGQDIALITANGIVMRTGTEKISRMSRATRGVIVMRPGEGDEVVSLAHMTEREPVEAGEGDEDAVGGEGLDAGDVIGAGDAQDGLEIVDAEDAQEGVENIDGAADSAPDAEPEVEATAPLDADEA